MSIGRGCSARSAGSPWSLGADRASIGIVIYLVFAQTDEPRVDAAAVAGHARKFFHCSIESDAAAGSAGMRIVLQSGASARFGLRARKATRDDHYAAREAEARGQAGGMGALAENCKCVWLIDFVDDAPAEAVFTACATLASVALGPVLPPDHSTLFGVRGAMERASGATR
jgi:hypothetical protein